MSSAAVSAASSCPAKPEKEEVEQPRLPPQGREGCSSAAAAGELEPEQERCVAAAVDRKLSEASLCASTATEEETEEDEEEDEEAAAAKDGVELGPRVSIREQLDKDKVSARTKRLDCSAAAARFLILTCSFLIRSCSALVVSYSI